MAAVIASESDRQLAVALEEIARLRAELASSHAQIAHLKDVQQSLRESEQQFRALVTHSPAGVFQCTPAGDCLFVNERYCAIAGISRADAVGCQWLKTLHPQDQQEVLRVWHAAREARAEFGMEFRFLRPDHSARWVFVSAVPLLDDSGEIASYRGSVLDITSRREMEEALSASEQRFRLLSDSAPIGIFLSDQAGHVIYVNPRLPEICGFEPADLLGWGFTKAVHHASRGQALSNWREIAASTRPHDVDRRLINRQGESRWARIRSVPILSPAGAVIGRVGTVEDITERIQAAERLSASEERIRGILDTAGDAIVSVDERGTIEMFNRAAERTFGYTAEEALGKDAGMLMRPQDRLDARWDAEPLAALRRLSGRVYEGFYQRRDGSACELEMRIGETRIGERGIFTAILHDIEQRKRTERMLRESEKLAATGRIAARIAHEINNPLAGIKSSFLLLKDAIPSDYKYFNYVRRIENEIDRIARIVRQMFDLYQPDRLSLREIHVGETVRDVVALLEAIAARAEVRLRLQVGGPACAVRLPEDSVRQVLYNVIINAIEASPRGANVEIHAHQTENQLQIAVADSGHGIPDDLKPQIYEPFFTTKSRSGTGGLGLGLPITRGIVEAMQGTLQFEDNTPSGTVFRIQLPLDPTAESAHGN